jgi:hypothetical protein
VCLSVCQVIGASSAHAHAGCSCRLRKLFEASGVPRHVENTNASGDGSPKRERRTSNARTTMAIDRTVGELPGHTYPDGMEERIKGRKYLSGYASGGECSNRNEGFGFTGATRRIACAHKRNRITSVAAIVAPHRATWSGARSVLPTPTRSAHSLLRSLTAGTTLTILRTLHGLQLLYILVRP